MFGLFLKPCNKKMFVLNVLICFAGGCDESSSADGSASAAISSWNRIRSSRNVAAAVVVADQQDMSPSRRT